jgi:hypothetical protein
VVFDSYEVQRGPGRELSHPLGDTAALEAHILQKYVDLPEEINEVFRIEEDGTVEVTSDIVEWLTRLTEWVVYHTIPREVRLVRNTDR